MSAIKGIFLLSLLAIFLAPRETEAQATISTQWSKFGQCAQVTIEAVTHLANKAVPTIYELKTCSGYVAQAPKHGQSRTVLWYMRVTYEFLKKVVLDQPKCLFELLNKVAAAIKPYSNQITVIGCLDENDFFI